MPEAPRSAPALVARATRVKTLPLILAPVGIGSALAAGRTGTFSWAWFVVAAAGAGALHLAAMVCNDVFDARSGADRIAGMDRSGVVTGSGLIDGGTVSERWMLGLAGALYGLAAVAGIAAAMQRATAVLWFGIAGAVLGVGYVAPPLRYGYRGRGLGQAGLFAAYGPLATAGAYLVQARALEASAWWAGVVPGVLVTLVYTDADLLHHRADKAVGKRTPAAVLGPEGGLLVSAALIVAAYAGLIAQVALELFPAVVLVGVLPLVPLAAAWTRAFRDPNPQRALNLLGASLGATVLTSVIVALGAALSR